MKVNRTSKTITQNINRALLDVRLGVAAGRKYAVLNNKPKINVVKYGAISTYRNLKSSDNLFPAALSGIFFFIPFYGAQPFGFVLGHKIQDFARSSIFKNLNKYVKNHSNKIAKSISR